MPPVSAKEKSPIAPVFAQAEGSVVLGAFEAEIVAVFADLVVLLGLPKSMGEIYGLIFASAEPVTFAEIEQKLKLSKGSVSQGLRALRELGAISEADETEGGGRMAGGRKAEDGRRKPEVGAKATRWKATTELRQLIGTLLRERLTPYLKRQDERMASATKSLSVAEATMSPAMFKTLSGRLSKLKAWQSRAGMILPLLGKML